MKLAQAFQGQAPEQIKSLLAGGALKIYSVARPTNPDAPITRSGLLATFIFANEAFGPDAPPALEGAVFVENPVLPDAVGTPGFARAYTADGVPVADLSVGPGYGEIRLGDVSTTPGFPIALTDLRLQP